MADIYQEDFKDSKLYVTDKNKALTIIAKELPMIRNESLATSLRQCQKKLHGPLTKALTDHERLRGDNQAGLDMGRSPNHLASFHEFSARKKMDVHSNNNPKLYDLEFGYNYENCIHVMVSYCHQIYRYIFSVGIASNSLRLCGSH